MKATLRMAFWGFLIGIVISVAVSFFYDFYDFFQKKPYSFVMMSRDEDVILFLWPSCILLLGTSADGINALMPVGIVALMNAIRYSVIFVFTGTLYRFFPAFSGICFYKSLHLFKFEKKSIKTLCELSVYFFFFGMVSAFIILTTICLQITLHANLSGLGGIITASLIPLLEMETFWNARIILHKMVKLIFFNGIAYSLASLFIGIFCNTIYLTVPHQKIQASP